MSIPSQVLYDSIKPIGYPTSTKIMRFTPQTGQNNIQPNDLVRFNFNTNGYWDPSTVYISLTVQLDPSFRKYDAIQIDGSASSFISEFIATCKGVEIERISEYDQIANILEDINYSNEQRFSRDIQGLGNNSKASSKPFGSTPNSVWHQRSEGEFRALTSLSAPRYFFQGFNPFFIHPNANVNNSLPDTFDNTNGNLVFNAIRLQTANVQIYNVVGAIGAVETNNSRLPQMALFKNLFGISGPCRYPPNSGISTGAGFDLTSKTIGGHDIVSNDLTQGCFEPVLIKDLGIPTMINGQIESNLNEKRNFAIPLYSGVFGQLMEKNDLKYLPMVAFQDLMMEFRINPYAIFTSGFSYLEANTNNLDTNYTTAVNSHLELQRKFVITKFEIVCEMLFFDPRVDSLILNQLSSSDGVVFPTQSWLLGPIISIPAGQTPSGNYQLNLGFESLKKICVTFMPPTQNNFSRKLYRVSAGITSMQLRIGMDLYPSMPIRGHSGTAGAYPSTYAYDNNNEYLIALYKAFGKFNNIYEDCSINSINFAINVKWTDVGNTQAPWNSDADRTMAPQHTVAFGQPLLYENIMKGKAIYALDLEGLGDDKKVVSGLNTNINRPIEIIFTSDSASAFKTTTGTTKPINMYIWCHYDMVVKLTKFSAQIMGRGN